MRSVLLVLLALTAISCVHVKDNEETASSGSLMRILKRQKDGSWKISRSIWTVDK